MRHARRQHRAHLPILTRHSQRLSLATLQLARQNRPQPSSCRAVQARHQGPRTKRCNPAILPGAPQLHALLGVYSSRHTPVRPTTCMAARRAQGVLTASSEPVASRCWQHDALLHRRKLPIATRHREKIRIDHPAQPHWHAKQCTPETADNPVASVRSVWRQSVQRSLMAAASNEGRTTTSASLAPLDGWPPTRGGAPHSMDADDTSAHAAQSVAPPAMQQVRVSALVAW